MGARRRLPPCRLGALGLVPLLACASTPGASHTDDPHSADARVFTMRVHGLDGARALETDDASGTICEHCGGGPTVGFGGTMRSAQGEDIQLTVTLAGTCFDHGFRRGWNYMHHATLRRGENSWDEAERAKRGRVWVQCRRDQTFLDARFHLRFPSGRVHGHARGEVRKSAGYE